MPHRDLHPATVALQVLEAALQQLDAALAIATVDNRGDCYIAFSNAACAELTGHSVEDLLGRQLVTLAAPDDRPALRALLGRNDLAGEPAKLELELERSEVERLPVEVGVSVPAPSALADRYRLVVFRDLRDRQADRDRLHLLESVVVNARDAIAIAEAGEQNGTAVPSRVVYVNDAYLELTGYSLAEAIGRPPLHPVPVGDAGGRNGAEDPAGDRAAGDVPGETLRDRAGEDPPAADRTRASSTANAAQPSDAAPRGPRPQPAEIRARRKSGSEFWLELSWFPIRDRQGRISHWGSVQRDVTARKQAEAMLRESQALFQLLTENVSDLVCLHAPDGRYLYVSPSSETMLGYRPRELLGEDPYALFHPDDRDRIRQESHAIVLTNKTPTPVLYRARRRSGEYVWLETLVQPIADENGRVTRLQSASRDVTARVEAQQVLERQNRQIQLFAEIALKIRQSFDLDTILNTAVREIQSILQCDRVVIYRFDESWAGRFVVEATAPGCQPLLGQQVYDPCFAENHIERYRQGRVSAIEDVDRAGLESCHVALLQRYGVRANLVVPVLQTPLGSWGVCPAGESTAEANWAAKFADEEPHLWGLLIAHHCAGPRPWREDEVDLQRQLADQVGVALSQAQLLEALQESEERYTLAVRGANDGLWDWDLKGDRLYYSPRWKSLLGYGDANIGNGPEEWFDRVHPADRDRVLSALNAHLRGLADHFESEHRLRHADGSDRWVLARGLAVRDRDGQAYRIAGSLTDITDLKRTEDQLLRDALHDPLTGLPNRALFSDRLGQALARSHRDSSEAFAVLFLDIDRFKVINDSLGHLAGDRLLVAVARRLEDCLSDRDTVARFGGDEFAILLANTADASQAGETAERIQATLHPPFRVDGREFAITSSIGIALSTVAPPEARDYVLPGDLLRDADLALYRAKEQGKDRYALFDRSMHDRAVAQMQLEHDLRYALENDEFRVFYQPIVDLNNGRLRGFEALVRWQHPERGLVSPAEFVPLAEETGAIVPLGAWVLHQACEQTARWQAELAVVCPVGPLAAGEEPALGCPPDSLTISVNLSARQFARSDLLETVDRVLADTGLPPECLKLEIVESVVMSNAETAINALKQLRNKGVRLSIDDFGTGYSSLSYLQRFPVDTIKVDRAFVGTLQQQNENWAIVRAIVALAQALGMDVVAEGVETLEAVRLLRSLQCPYGQGYLFSRPLPADEARSLLRQQFAV